MATANLMGGSRTKIDFGKYSVDYIGKTDLARVALRTARDNNIPDEKWQKFIDEINSSSQGGSN